ncbi:tRNA 2-thiouridine synthesizing protein A [Neorhizobium galegae]|uniref:sulfurtransferase TusA family protein n=1 Tax=Neorhizobium galegae TaxID=399 RepID=UPI001AE981D1|nr:sulfurtransferase TusA family protein [Neorhizobium galegae]MBP2550249.1 tRNA 2-thiouridine synthesizing protein A [Neorhizobium galegae]
MPDQVYDHQLYNLRGLKCPLPVLKTRRKLGLLPVGTVLVVDTTDPLAGLDIPHFCREDGHTLLSQEKTADGHRFFIRKDVDAADSAPTVPDRA